MGRDGTRCEGVWEVVACAYVQYLRVQYCFAVVLDTVSLCVKSDVVSNTTRRVSPVLPAAKSYSS